MPYSELQNDSENKTWPIYLVFVFMTVPFLLSFCEKRQDCYSSSSDCEKDWNSSDCQPKPDPVCRYVGRSYSGFDGGGTSGKSIGSISRGGFGGIGKAFSAGG